MNIVESNGLLQLNKKLQYLKFAIKAWSKESNSSSSINKSDLHDIDSIEALEIPQKVKKAKIHWSIEGDENSKYFHDILNNKQSQLSVSGILDKGDWIDDPSIVKMKFLEHFSHHISKPVSNCLKTEFPFPNQLSLIHVNNLDCEVLNMKSKSVIWKCGMNKSPGLDGSTFKFFCKFWSTIKNDVVAAAKAFFSPGIFNGISLNESLMPLVYADNDVSVGEWDVSNIKTLVYVLKDVEKATRLIRCLTFSTPFNYLGVKPGDDMSKIKSWDEIIDTPYSIEVNTLYSIEVNTPVWSQFDTAYPMSWIWRIGGFLEHRYTVSSLMDTAYWLSEQYTNDTLQILGLPEEHHISWFVHGLRTRSLVEFLSTDVPTTYKGLMEKTSTWIEEKDVATNGAPNDNKEGSNKFSKNFSWDHNKGKKTNQIKEAVKSEQLAHLVNGIKKGKAKTFDTQLGYALGKIERITFPTVLCTDPYSYLVTIKVRVSGRQVNQVDMDGRTSCKVI
ncbi:hypothetical protein Tco_0290739 [Tanacetum coccineum]